MTDPDPISSFETDRLLAWRVDIIDHMIRENPEYTIADYFSLLEELKQIKSNDQ